MTRSPRYDRRGNEGGLDDGDKMGREDFEDWVLNRLSELGEIAVLPRFGGQGIYWRGVIFGMVFQERLDFKVDDQSKGEYLARGMGRARQISWRLPWFPGLFSGCFPQSCLQDVFQIDGWITAFAEASG